MALPKVLVLAGGAGGRLWPTHTREGADAAALVADGGQVENSPGATVGGDGDITLVGAATELPAGSVVNPGGRWPEPD